MLVPFLTQHQSNEEFNQIRKGAKTLPRGVRCIDCRFTDKGWVITNLATGEVLTKKQYERKYNKKLNLPTSPPFK